MELLAAPVLLCTSYWYFKTAPAKTGMALRLLASAHGICAVIFLASAILIGLLGIGSQPLSDLYRALQAIPLILILLSVYLFPGPKEIHWLQILNIPATLWSAFIGLMAVSGKWL
ncbi:hypothetical protein [Pseudomonas sp. SCB32]|uniref:hypothetical protein n=1 Tax=Pseudomonas sp. SCB32 TaxID=2653853 RepID=UPI0012652C7F|nr:hypothetical protein [Pseudomonas sp. SCB32]